ncbi:16487_t:CDS:2, partial [Gigaspora rosea]
HTDSNLVSNSDTNPEDTGISSNESLSGDNISANLNSNTEHSNKTSDTDHSITDNDLSQSNKNLVLSEKTSAGFGIIFAEDVHYKNGKHVTQGSTGNFQTHLELLNLPKLLM